MAATRTAPARPAAELVTAAYRESFFANGAAVASVRAGNVIGGGDWAPDRIIPDSVRALVAGQPIFVRNPDAIRPWQHVLEPLSGYLRLGSLLLADGRRLRRAPGTSARRRSGPISRCAGWSSASSQEWGSGSWTTPASAEGQPHEAQRLSLDSTKAREQLDWAPVWDPSEAVRRTASWYREYYRAPASARDLVEHELEAYQDDARAAGLTWASGNGDRTTR